MLERDDVGMPDDTRDWRREALCVGTDPELFCVPRTLIVGLV